MNAEHWPTTKANKTLDRTGYHRPISLIVSWNTHAQHHTNNENVAAAPGLQLLAYAPNPFNALTAIRFELPAAGAYDVENFDTAGRRVTAFHGVGAAGLNEVGWDGRDAAGAVVGSGVYCYCVRSAAGIGNSTMILVK